MQGHTCCLAAGPGGSSLHCTYVVHLSLKPTCELGLHACFPAEEREAVKLSNTVKVNHSYVWTSQAQTRVGGSSRASSPLKMTQHCCHLPECPPAVLRDGPLLLTLLLPTFSMVPWTVSPSGPPPSTPLRQL